MCCTRTRRVVRKAGAHKRPRVVCLHPRQGLVGRRAGMQHVLAKAAHPGLHASSDCSAPLGSPAPALRPRDVHDAIFLFLFLICLHVVLLRPRTRSNIQVVHLPPELSQLAHLCAGRHVSPEHSVPSMTRYRHDAVPACLPARMHAATGERRSDLGAWARMFKLPVGVRDLLKEE